MLVANCPVCHQSVSLAARLLEANGIATVVMGCAKDIVEYVGVPRFVFSDFPLGNAAGRPNDPDSQAATLELALALLEKAPAARTTVQSPLLWSQARLEARLSKSARMSPQEIAAGARNSTGRRPWPRRCAKGWTATRAQRPAPESSFWFQAERRRQAHHEGY